MKAKSRKSLFIVTFRSRFYTTKKPPTLIQMNLDQWQKRHHDGIQSIYLVKAPGAEPRTQPLTKEKDQLKLNKRAQREKEKITKVKRLNC